MVFITSNKQRDYHEFIGQVLDMLADEDIDSMAIVSLTGDKKTVTNYWHMGLSEKEQAEMTIRKDAMTDFINVNRDYFFPTEMDCTEDCEDEQGA